MACILFLLPPSHGPERIRRAALQAYPSWQLLLVDLRCHGESARLPTRPDGPHTVNTAANDILRLLGRLKLFPEVLIGHSFGGKVRAAAFPDRLSTRPAVVRTRPPNDATALCEWDDETHCMRRDQVVMSMAEQFGSRLGSRLPRPVKVRGCHQGQANV